MICKWDHVLEVRLNLWTLNKIMAPNMHTSKPRNHWGNTKILQAWSLDSNPWKQMSNGPIMAHTYPFIWPHLYPNLAAKTPPWWDCVSKQSVQLGNFQPKIEMPHKHWLHVGCYWPRFEMPLKKKKKVKDQLFTIGPLLAHNALSVAITTPYVPKLNLILPGFLCYPENLWSEPQSTSTNLRIKDLKIYCIIQKHIQPVRHYTKMFSCVILSSEVFVK